MTLSVQLEEAKTVKTVDDYPWRMAEYAGRKYSTNKLKVGRLGRVSYEQAKAHEDAGKKTHEWMFDSQHAARSGMGVQTIQSCMVCHFKRTVDRKGRPIYR